MTDVSNHHFTRADHDQLVSLWLDPAHGPAAALKLAATFLDERHITGELQQTMLTQLAEAHPRA